MAHVFVALRNLLWGDSTFTAVEVTEEVWILRRHSGGSPQFPYPERRLPRVLVAAFGSAATD
jgi:hypothetical protein